MADALLSPERNAIRYGIFSAIGMSIYLVIASLFGFASNMSYSWLNQLVLVIGICMSIAHFKRVRHDRMPYLQGFGTGIMTGIVGSVLFALFFVIYVALFPNLMEELREEQLFGFDLSVTIAFLAIVLQGSWGGMIISLVAMQYFKSPDHKPLQHIE
ncbi:DUF4199 domain-containing protein [Solirubrum puertoriconensis]|uniref:DUF4199 domain-containing protein n=1 Tax=Solirubrum puertoriconensis TaxID=1751427 RepID=A0A9X0HKS6_SOLP1|nr:DUF4199 domain-containing protein [Solirubrum puertoriconensis]KUG07729.1 hypothetical protein ASU33_15540 [Solirubrum puertoriconensis]